MIVAGFGFRGAATAQSLHDAYVAACGSERPGLLATAEDKAETPAFRALAQRLGLPVLGVPAGTLAAQITQTASVASQSARGTGSVAEAAALAVAGPGARLIAPRALSPDRMATCAVATGETP